MRNCSPTRWSLATVKGTSLVALALLWAQPSPGAPPAAARSYEQVNEPGFGDRRNSYSWSMRWFKGKLYVGRNREFPCVESATLNSHALPVAPVPSSVASNVPPAVSPS